MKRRFFWLAFLSVLILALGTQAAFALSGAIFTTNSTGTWVNGNTKYTSKTDVYLDGGPGPNAPVSAAGLPQGDYYFQVTDPPGKTLLSCDSIYARRVRVNAYGVIDKIYPAEMPDGTPLPLVKCDGKSWGTHAAGTEADHGGDPWKAITVQLMPYANTPNNGGVYKVWMTPVADYAEGQGKFGFIPSKSKTDNFKVKQVTPPKITVRKFLDKNLDGDWDGRGMPGGEPELIDEWSFTWADPLGTISGPKKMPYTIYNCVPAGDWVFQEEMMDGWFQTAALVDGVKEPHPLDLTATVKVLGDDKETHEVCFGNAPKACAKAFKYWDKDLSGTFTEGDKPVEGVMFHLDGIDLWGETVHREVATGSDGIAEFKNLMPSNAAGYTITEHLTDKQKEEWFNTTPTSWVGVVGPGDAPTASFGNAKYGCLYADKFYDLDCDGIKDDGEPAVPGIWYMLEGTTYKGDPVGPLYAMSGADGLAWWCKLYPGDYQITEILPAEHWACTSPNPQCVKLGQSGDVGGAFGNICWRCAGFHTKGFWHNKNGLEILTAHPEWIAYVNTLPAYADNPFDGIGADGKPVPAAFSDEDNAMIWGAGTWQAEVSNFLTNNNKVYIQLQQQLLAFIFNTKNCEVAGVEAPGGGWISADDIIKSAQDALKDGVDANGCDQQYWVTTLTAYNENKINSGDGYCVKVVCSSPCDPGDYFTPPTY